MPEILAPVGGAQQLDAALRAGANAVYLGTQLFNARRNAENFSGENLPEVVSACHLAGVRVHITFNTLIEDKELPLALKELKKIADAGVDAVIVQDPAVAALLKKHCPSLELHASTQMAIHNAEGAIAAYEMGFRRVVLARELSFEEIKRIRRRIPEDLELEVFVHGALCVSLSGGCYLSSLIGGRSGNRGLCAGPCRLNFQCRGREYALSLKDMSYIGHLKELSDAGVTSFKIEGRMKGSAYVATAVHACRVALEGGKPDMETLGKVFSRSGFTDGYYTGDRNAAMFGTRTKEDALAASAAEKSAAPLLRGVFQSVGLDAELTMEGGKASFLTLSDGVHRVTAEGTEPIVPNQISDEKEAFKNLFKTGGTPFYINTLTIHNTENLMLPPSTQNALRRECLEKLTSLRQKITPYPFSEETMVFPPVSEHQHTGIWLRALKPEQLDFDEEAEKIMLPADCLNAELAERYRNRLIAVLPEVSFEEDSGRLYQAMERLKKLGIREVEVNQIGMLYAARKEGFLLHGGCGLNIYNSLALEIYREQGLADAVVSFEASARDIAQLGGKLPRGIIGYGILPLMRLRSCPGRSEKGCGKCPGYTTLTDRLGKKFPVSCDGRRYSTLYNTLPLYVGEKDRRPKNVDFSVLYFTFETAEEARKIYRNYLKGVPAGIERTNGLYYRETK